MRTDSDGLAVQAPVPQATAPTRVPVVKADTAMLSLRSSGHDFCSAVGEVADNSLEAAANVIKVRSFTSKKKVGTNTRATEVIERVAIGDDGEGMSKEVLHKCLQLGYSTRYNSRIGMGRFGVGAKLGGISQAKRIDVYSRRTQDEPWLCTFIDLRDIEAGKDEILEPVPAELPEDCQDLVGPDHGTLVIWSETDRLQERETGGARQAGRLESDLVSYVSRTFRKFLDGGKQIWINDTCIKPHDPLFLMNSTRFHQVPEKTTVKLPDFPASLKFPRACADRIFYDVKSKILTYKGAMPDQHRVLLLGLTEREEFASAVNELFGRKATDEETHACVTAFHNAVEAIYDRSNPDPTGTVLHAESFEWPIPTNLGQTSTVEVTITLLPEKFWAREKYTDRPGGSPAAKERRIDENEGVSILRAGREIFYGYLRDVQPPAKDIDRFIGIEIRFRPDLDECFQVRNVKKGAEPVNGLRDKLETVIHKTVLTGRNQLNSRYAALKAQKQADSGIHAEAEQVVQEAKDVSPKPRAGEDIAPGERQQKVDEAAEVLTRNTPHRREEVARAILNQPVKIVPQSWPGSDFLHIDHLGTTAIVHLNTQHPFYTEVYSKLVAASDPKADPNAASLARAVQIGLDLLLMSYAQAEGVEKDAEQKYGTLRSYWGNILKNNIQQWAKSQSR